MSGEMSSAVRERFQARLLDVVDDGVVGTDADFRITHWNVGAQRLYGYPADEVLGLPASQVASFPEDEQRDRLERELLEHGRSRSEITAVRRDGTPVDVELAVTAVRDETGAVQGYLGIHRDVTARRHAARHLEQLSSAVAHSRDVIAFADVDGRALFVNDAGLRLLGLREDAEGREITEFVAEHDRARVCDDVLPSAMRDGHCAQRLDLQDLTDGAPVPVLCQAFRVDDPVSGRPMGIATISRDLRGALRQETLLHDAERRTAAVLESVADPVLGLDADGRLTFVNEAAVRLVARLRGDPQVRGTLVGAQASAVLPTALGGPVARAAATARAERRPVDGGRHPDGTGAWWEIRVSPAGGGTSVVLRDVSDRRAAEAASARCAEQHRALADLGARSARVGDLGAFLEDAVRRVAQAVDADFAFVAQTTRAGDRLVVRAGTGLEHADAMVVGTSDAADLVGHALASRAAVVADDVLAEGRFDVAPALRAHRPGACVVVPVAGPDEVHGVLAVFSRAPARFAAPDVDVVAVAAHLVTATFERARTGRTLERAREAERQRIAGALHDEALQDVRYALARAEAPPDGLQRDELLVESLSRIDHELRGAVYDLRIDDEQRSLEDLLTQLVALHRRMTPGLLIDLRLAELAERPTQRTRGELVRIIGEALTNVRRHAGARRVRVRAWTRVGELWCDVTDDGCGVGANAASGRGIAGMRERAARLGGHVGIRSPDAGGTAVQVRLPLAPPREAGPAIRVLLVEDHAAVREAIANAFRHEPDFEVVGEAATLAEARGLLDGIDVALIDLGLPDGDGGELIAALREADPNAHALVLSAGLDRSAVARAVERGAAGALPKTTHLPDVIDAVRRVRAGETLLPLDEVVELLRLASRERERELLDRQAIESLTSREVEVLQLIADGCDSRQAASQLHISVRTQRNHVANVLGKLGVHSQLQALIFALRYELVELRPTGC